MVVIAGVNYRHIVESEWRMVMDMEVVDRRIDAFTLHIGISYARIMASERLPSILEVLDIRSMPDAPHRVDLAEFDLYPRDILKLAGRRHRLQIILFLLHLFSYVCYFRHIVVINKPLWTYHPNETGFDFRPHEYRSWALPMPKSTAATILIGLKSVAAN